MGKKQTVEEQKMISFGRLVFEALPEAWSFQIITSLGLAIISKVIVWMMTSVAEVSGGALTTANIKDLLLSWRAPVLLVLTDVVLISLSYDVIDYAETNYPEFETGTLFFGGIGNVANLNCDLLIMEEEMATENRISQIHNAGKQAIVWTVNTKEAMHSFLDSNIDAVITDEIELAEQAQRELDARTEYEVLEAQLKDTWK